MPDLHGKFEPEAREYGDPMSAAATSIAISLKRIADALSGDAANIFTKPINSYGMGIGDAIQGQFVRGQAGIAQYERGR
jgi:hypothetical protein